MKCKHCSEELCTTKPFWMGQKLGWVYLRGKYRHASGYTRRCDPKKVSDKPKCYVCLTEDSHAPHCSLRLPPAHYAEPETEDLNDKCL